MCLVPWKSHHSAQSGDIVERVADTNHQTWEEFSFLWTDRQYFSIQSAEKFSMLVTTEPRQNGDCGIWWQCDQHKTSCFTQGSQAWKSDHCFFHFLPALSCTETLPSTPDLLRLNKWEEKKILSEQKKLPIISPTSQRWSSYPQVIMVPTVSLTSAKTLTSMS